MTESNPYAPPKSAVGDFVNVQPAPPLWNPNAAASWSVLLSPIFGAVLHMKNWAAMGETEKAAQSKRWVVGICAFFAVFLLASIVLPESKAIDGLGRAVALALLITWYYVSGKQQSAFVLARYGKDYPRRGWGKPLLFAVLAFVGLMVVAVVVGLVLAMLGVSA